MKFDVVSEGVVAAGVTGFVEHQSNQLQLENDQLRQVPAIATRNGIHGNQVKEQQMQLKGVHRRGRNPLRSAPNFSARASATAGDGGDRETYYSDDSSSYDSTEDGDRLLPGYRRCFLRLCKATLRWVRNLYFPNAADECAFVEHHHYVETMSPMVCSIVAACVMFALGMFMVPREISPLYVKITSFGGSGIHVVIAIYLKVHRNRKKSESNHLNHDGQTTTTTSPPRDHHDEAHNESSSVTTTQSGARRQQQQQHNNNNDPHGANSIKMSYRIFLVEWVMMLSVSILFLFFTLVGTIGKSPANCDWVVKTVCGRAIRNVGALSVVYLVTIGAYRLRAIVALPFMVLWTVTFVVSLQIPDFLSWELQAACAIIFSVICVIAAAASVASDRTSRRHFLSKMHLAAEQRNAAALSKFYKSIVASMIPEHVSLLMARGEVARINVEEALVCCIGLLESPNSLVANFGPAIMVATLQQCALAVDSAVKFAMSSMSGDATILWAIYKGHAFGDSFEICFSAPPNGQAAIGLARSVLESSDPTPRRSPITTMWHSASGGCHLATASPATELPHYLEKQQSSHVAAFFLRLAHLSMGKDGEKLTSTAFCVAMAHGPATAMSAKKNFSLAGSTVVEARKILRHTQRLVDTQPESITNRLIEKGLVIAVKKTHRGDNDLGGGGEGRLLTLLLNNGPALCAQQLFPTGSSSASPIEKPLCCACGTTATGASSLAQPAMTHDSIVNFTQSRNALPQPETSSLEQSTVTSSWLEGVVNEYCGLFRCAGRCNGQHCCARVWSQQEFSLRQSHIHNFTSSQSIVPVLHIALPEDSTVLISDAPPTASVAALLRSSDSADTEIVLDSTNNFSFPSSAATTSQNYHFEQHQQRFLLGSGSTATVGQQPLQLNGKLSAVAFEANRSAMLTVNSHGIISAAVAALQLPPALSMPAAQSPTMTPSGGRFQQRTLHSSSPPPPGAGRSSLVLNPLVVRRDDDLRSPVSQAPADNTVDDPKRPSDGSSALPLAGGSTPVEGVFAVVAGMLELKPMFAWAPWFPVFLFCEAAVEFEYRRWAHNIPDEDRGRLDGGPPQPTARSTTGGEKEAVSASHQHDSTLSVSAVGQQQQQKAGAAIKTKKVAPLRPPPSSALVAPTFAANALFALALFFCYVIDNAVETTQSLLMIGAAVVAVTSVFIPSLSVQRVAPNKKSHRLKKGHSSSSAASKLGMSSNNNNHQRSTTVAPPSLQGAENEDGEVVDVAAPYYWILDVTYFFLVYLSYAFIDDRTPVADSNTVWSLVVLLLLNLRDRSESIVICSMIDIASTVVFIILAWMTGPSTRLRMDLLSMSLPLISAIAMAAFRFATDLSGRHRFIFDLKLTLLQMQMNQDAAHLAHLLRQMVPDQSTENGRLFAKLLDAVRGRWRARSLLEEEEVSEPPRHQHEEENEEQQRGGGAPPSALATSIARKTLMRLPKAFGVRASLFATPAIDRPTLLIQLPQLFDRTSALSRSDMHDRSVWMSMIDEALVNVPQTKLVKTDGDVMMFVDEQRVVGESCHSLLSFVTALNIQYQETQQRHLPKKNMSFAPAKLSFAPAKCVLVGGPVMGAVLGTAALSFEYYGESIETGRRLLSSDGDLMWSRPAGGAGNGIGGVMVIATARFTEWLQWLLIANTALATSRHNNNNNNNSATIPNAHSNDTTVLQSMLSLSEKLVTSASPNRNSYHGQVGDQRDLRWWR
ncbi:transmembrane protein, putative [Bodo saltans]|uniref:Transmembrane protein, putative n=1 Tax=Bodo saltans TaxID=75058 RepID=A0A0S4J978_BODSA|nr:transmembrane protein, putative [Bodo saltans]|eukprot:CUG87030.1 transmembrane protein, putative [Bodo saltans]